MKEVVIFAHDPGTKNYGYSLVKVCFGKKLKVEVLETGISPAAVYDLKTNDKTTPKLRVSEFLKWVKKYKRKYKFDYIVAERFMTRGGSSMGTTIECVGIMCGAMIATMDNVQLVTAAQWKNIVNRTVDLKALYKNKEYYLGEPHELDATLMAIYKAGQLLGVVDPYQGIDIYDVCLNIEEVSTCQKTIDRLRKAM